MAIKMKKVLSCLSALAHAGMVAAPMLVDAGVGCGSREEGELWLVHDLPSFVDMAVYNSSHMLKKFSYCEYDEK